MMGRASCEDDLRAGVRNMRLFVKNSSKTDGPRPGSYGLGPISCYRRLR